MQRMVKNRYPPGKESGRGRKKIIKMSTNGQQVDSVKLNEKSKRKKRKQEQSDQRRTNGRIVPTADSTIIINNYKGPLRQPFN